MRKTSYRVSCRRPVFLLNLLLRAGVLAEKTEWADGALCFVTSYAQSALVDRLLEENGLTYKKGGYIGLKPLMKRLLSRPFLLAATALSLALVAVFGNFIYGYSVKGNEQVNTSSIESILRENGVDGFVWKGQVDLVAVKRQISALEGVSFASVKVTGNRLSVEIKEELPHVTPDEPQYAAALSLYPAVVTKVVAESGTPLVRSGDVVSPGDVLVAPVHTFTEGEEAAPARAAVWGVVTYQKEVLLPCYTVESVLTGETFTQRRVTFFGKEMGKTAPVPFDAYDLEERVLFSALGVKVTERIYRQRAAKQIFHDLDAEAERVAEEALVALLLSVPFYAVERGQVRVIQKKVDNVLYSVLYYSVEQRIDSLFTAR